jgi:hypothetical protein
MQVGYTNDLSYYYLGHAAENLGYWQAAQCYYRIAERLSVTQMSCAQGEANIATTLGLPAALCDGYSSLTRFIHTSRSWKHDSLRSRRLQLRRLRRRPERNGSSAAHLPKRRPRPRRLIQFRKHQAKRPRRVIEPAPAATPTSTGGFVEPAPSASDPFRAAAGSPLKEPGT